MFTASPEATEKDEITNIVLNFDGWMLKVMMLPTGRFMGYDDSASLGYWSWDRYKYGRTDYNRLRKWLL